MKFEEDKKAPLPLLWWVKFASVVVALCFGLSFVIPTFTGDPTTWARYEDGPQKGRPKSMGLRLVEDWLPQNRIALGLDLRGGMHLGIDVDVETSVKESILRALSRVRENAQAKGIAITDLKVEDNYNASFVVSNPSQKDDIIKMVSDQTFYVGFDALDGNTFRFKPNQVQIQKFSEQIMGQAIKTVRNRIDQFNVSEPSIFQQGERRIIVQMPGLQDPERAKGLLKNTAQLDFRLVLNKVPAEQLLPLLAEAKAALKIDEKDTQVESIEKASDWLRNANKIPSNSTIMLERKFDPNGTGKVISANPYLLESVAKLTGDHIENAVVDNGGSSSSILPEVGVSLKFKEAGTRLFADLTEEATKSENRPNQIAIILDKNVVSAPTVHERISGGSAKITMGRRGNSEVSQREAEDLALVLRAGSLPASVKIVEERVVGPSEGEGNIRAGVLSSGIACAAVVLMMFLIYGLSGMVANLAMLFNILFILAFLALFGATLTLPGIAGIVLTMAVAVDGNVIINERIREELRSGHTGREAFYRGYSHSFVTLVDAHVTSAVAGLVLLVYGNPAVKGFAITLLVGIISTLFTSYYVTEVIGQWLVEKTKIKRFS